MSTQTKFTQKVDYFTVFESFPSTSCCSQKFPPNKIEKIGWVDMLGSIRDAHIGRVVGNGLAGKVYSLKLWWGTSEVQKPCSLEGLCSLLNGWNEANSTPWMFGLLKQAATLDIASPDTCQCLKPPCSQAFRITMNSPLLQSASSR